jgi:hypothetical protein
VTRPVEYTRIAVPAVGPTPPEGTHITCAGVYDSMRQNA